MLVALGALLVTLLTAGGGALTAILTALASASA